MNVGARLSIHLCPMTVPLNSRVPKIKADFNLIILGGHTRGTSLSFGVFCPVSSQTFDKHPYVRPGPNSKALLLIYNTALVRLRMRPGRLETKSEGRGEEKKKKKKHGGRREGSFFLALRDICTAMRARGPADLLVDSVT